MYRVRSASLLCLLITIAGATFQNPDKPPDTIKTADLDREIYDLLRTVINAGADLYNRDSDRPGCYRLYQGCLLTLRPILRHRPELQKEIDTALAEADRMPAAGGRAFRLRYALDLIRQKCDPKQTGGAEKKPLVVETPSRGTPSEITKLELKPSELWTRLGGETVVRKIVDDWVKLAANDPKIHFNRDPKTPLPDAKIADLKTKLVAFISQVSHGPIQYTGKSMKESHQGMGITDAEFDAMVADLKQAMASRGIGSAEVQDLVSQMEATRKDIVEPAKPEPKKGKI